MFIFFSLLMFFIAVTFIYGIVGVTKDQEDKKRKKEELNALYAELDRVKKAKQNYLDEELRKIQQENRDWQKGFDKVTEIFNRAKELEKTDPRQAIKLYESIRDTNYGKFGTLQRLAVLYNKVGDKAKLIQTLDFLIEETQTDEYNRMEFTQKKFPNDAHNVKFCYEAKLPYTTPEGRIIDFHSRVDQLKKRLEKEQSKFNKTQLT